MVFARTAHAKRALAAQFREHTIDRVYHAIAHGTVTAKRVETHLLLDRGDGMRGSHGFFRRPDGDVPIEAKRSVTHIRPIAALVGATGRMSLKPDASIRFESTWPNSAIRWSANACTSATTPAP
jgi:23S rRNA-/tRNA-specific pseudouridylate synthase